MLLSSVTEILGQPNIIYMGYIGFFGTGTTQVIGNVKHPCSVCLKGVGVNSIRCAQCVQWVDARYSRVKGSLKKVESSFICRRCKGELCETRQVNSQVNGLHTDGHKYEIVDKFCYLGEMLSQKGSVIKVAVTKGKCRQRETWWWCDEVEKAVETKKQKFNE